jgi:hypothetical protein
MFEQNYRYPWSLAGFQLRRLDPQLASGAMLFREISMLPVIGSNGG